MNTYDPNTLYEKPKKKKKRKWKGFVIFLAVCAVILAIGIGVNDGLIRISGSENDYKYDEDYIAILEVHGTMNDDDSDPEYNQTWLLERIDQMMDDSCNRGLMLSIDTPGGSVYPIDELYLKIKAYQKNTGRPVYAYMESMAASGGYYISAPADKIYANRNCWTGSIGVTVGTVYDISEFLDGLGIKTVTITAGENKAMGSAVEPLTKEQKAIYQSLVDEAYDQFVDIVAKGRGMKRKEVVALADGRVYTAKQAKANGLIDEIATREEAIAEMKKACGLESVSHELMQYEAETTLSSLFLSICDLGKSEARNEYDEIMNLLAEHQTFDVTYMSVIRK